MILELSDVILSENHWKSNYFSKHDGASVVSGKKMVYNAV